MNDPDARYKEDKIDQMREDWAMEKGKKEFRIDMDNGTQYAVYHQDPENAFYLVEIKEKEDDSFVCGATRPNPAEVWRYIEDNDE